MDESAVKESRVMLRQIQDHLLAVHALAGATQESAGMVDVLYHPTNPLPQLNYVLPRKNTAWVPTGTIEQGLLRLVDLKRQPGFQYIEGLFPPQFGETLRKIELEPESVRPVFAFRPGGSGGVSSPRPAVRPGADQRIRRVDAARGARLWAQAQGNGWLALLPNALPVPDAAQAYDLVAYQAHAPAAILRIEVQPHTGTAHFAALSQRAGSDVTLALLAAGVRSALRHGGKLVFALPERSAFAEVLADLHFVELGRLLRYAPARAASELEHSHGHLAQPVLAGH